MGDPRPAHDRPADVPLLQRMYDSPFLLLALGLVIMLGIFTFWGLWEVLHLPPATLP